MWYPAEAVTSIRPGWFWHAAEDTQLKTLSQLLDLYYDSVGRNSVLLLNVPPNAQGLLATPDVAAMDQTGAAIRAIYQSNVVAARPAFADSVFKNAPGRAASMAVDGKIDTFWAAGEGKTSARLEFDLGAPRAFNVVSIQEPIALGERTTQHHVEAKSNGAWTTIASGTAIGRAQAASRRHCHGDQHRSGHHPGAWRSRHRRARRLRVALSVTIARFLIAGEFFNEG